MKTKTTLRLFSICDYDKEAEYLRQMHNSGWKFTGVSGLMYHFEECTPCDVIYQLDYNQEGIAHKDEYVRMFSDFGWEYLQDYMGYSYFRKEAGQTENDEDIFCDDNSRAEMLERIYKGRVRTLIILFLCIIIPGFSWSIATGDHIITILYSAIIVIYLSLFATLLKRYLNFKK